MTTGLYGDGSGGHGVRATQGLDIPGPTGQPMVVKIGGEESRGAYSLLEYSHAAGAKGPPAHVHHHHEEAFMVLEGELTLVVDGSPVRVGPGQSAVVPRGCVHQPTNASDAPVRFVFINSPAMDDFFVALSQLVADHGGRPPTDALLELGQRHDSIFVDLTGGGSVTLTNEGGGG
jgi:mannose-6-phosphate isomerase-like protein (cupin superfamily)